MSRQQVCSSQQAVNGLADLTRDIQTQEEIIRQGGGKAGQLRQEKLGRLTARQRLSELLDNGTPLLELGLWAAWRMYPEWGDVPAAGVLAAIGQVHGRPVMVVANDATVKAGACFPQTIKKVFARAAHRDGFSLAADLSGRFVWHLPALAG